MALDICSLLREKGNQEYSKKNKKGYAKDEKILTAVWRIDTLSVAIKYVLHQITSLCFGVYSVQQL